MKTLPLLVTIMMGLPPMVAGQWHRVSGRIIADTLPLPAATVLLGNRHAHTDASGFFAFDRMDTGLHTLVVSYVGYRTYSQVIKIDHLIHRQLPDIILKKDTATLGIVTISNGPQPAKSKDEVLSTHTVNEEYLRRHLGGSLMQSLEKLPGIKSIGIGTGNSKPLIRGLGFNQVAVVENGIKHEGQQWGADHGLEIDQYAAGRIEVIKGPTAFLYGSDAMGGAINIQAAPPPAKNSLGGSLDITGKTNNAQWAGSAQLFARTNRWFITTRFTSTAYGDFRIPTDTVFVYSYAVPLHHRQVRNTAGSEYDLHLSTGWISNHIESIFYASRVFNKAGFFANAHGLEPRRVNTAVHDHSSRDILLPSQEVTHYKLINQTRFRIDRHRLEWHTGYQQNFRQERNRYVNHGYMPPVFPAYLTMPATLERQYDKIVLASTLQDEWHQHNHHITVGASTEYQRNKIDGWSFLIPAFTQTQAGLFIHDKINPTDKLTLLSAIRYDYGQINIQRYADWFASPVSEGNDAIAQPLVRAPDTVRRFSSFSFSAGINYTPGRFSLKANFGSSFRMPIAKELGANGVNYHYFRYEKGNIRLSPERSYQLDLGIGWTTPYGSVLLTPYLNYFQNYIYLNPTPAHDYSYGAGNQVFQYAQSKVLRYGAELQALYNFSPGWIAELAAEYLYNEQLTGVKKGYTLPFTPPPSASLSLIYEVPFRQENSKGYIGTEWRLTAAQNRIVPPERTTPAYQLLGLIAGASMALKDQPINISLQVRNLLNTRFLDHTSFYRLIELPEAGRNIVLSIHLPFIDARKATKTTTF